MSAFDQWYAANVEAQLPKDFPPQLRAAAKAEGAKIWNAALDECEKQISEKALDPDGLHGFEFSDVRVRVTP
jgi:hypothetical protein